MEGQINIFDYLSSIPVFIYGGCGLCICKKCLYWWSGRCPNGDCFDDKRAVEDPYDKAHPDKPPRTLWSDWNKPGEQAHWCRGGVCYPVYHCNHFKKYMGVKFEPCIRCDVVVYQDGYKYCSLVNSAGCETCYESMIQNLDDMEAEL